MINIKQTIVHLCATMQCISRKLAVRLIGGVAVILTLVFALTGILTIRGVHGNTLHYTDSIGQSISQTIANACIEPFLLEDYPVLETYANQLVRQNPLVVGIQYERQDDKVLVIARQKDKQGLKYDPLAIRHYKAPITTDAENDPLGYVTVDISIKSMKTLFRTHLLRLVAILTTSLVFIAVLLTIFLRRMIIKPVRELATYARSVGAGDFDGTLSIQSQDEIGQLARAFDEMKLNLKMSYSAIQEQNDKLVTLDKMKSQFLANMSHEIRTPMNAIVGFSNLLSDEDLTVEQKDEVNVIRESAQNMLYLINDILDFSKIEAGQLEIQIVDCSLGELLNSLGSMMKAQADEKSLDFQITTDQDVPAQIRSDPYRLRQCLINLVSNAIKFTNEGHVHLQVSLHQDGAKHFIRFDVEDTGIGIPQGRQAAIFESFTQGDGSTTREYGGTGLGLTVTKQLVELLDGELALTSETGKGSVFSMVIPTNMDITGPALLNPNKTFHQGSVESPTADATLFSGKVLVAEDVEGNQKLMNLMLSRLGLEVTIAEDGNQAVQKALSQSFDLVLMDMHMPHMNGYEATACLKRQGYKTPIVAVTANAMKGDDQKCMEAGCDGYLAKPIDRSELQRVVAKYLQPQQDVVDQADDDTILTPPGPCCLGTDSAPTPSGNSSAADLKDIVNWDQLIDRLGDEEIVRAVMPTYIEDTKKHFEELSEAVKMGDCAAIASEAHALKGAGRNLSLDHLADLAGQMEHAGRENDAETCTLLYSSLSTEIEKVLSVLAACDWTAKEKTV